MSSQEEVKLSYFLCNPFADILHNPKMLSNAGLALA